MFAITAGFVVLVLILIVVSRRFKAFVICHRWGFAIALIILAGMIVVAFLITGYSSVDACLDSGGRWNKETSSCQHEESEDTESSLAPRNPHTHPLAAIDHPRKACSYDYRHGGQACFAQPSHRHRLPWPSSVAHHPQLRRSRPSHHHHRTGWPKHRDPASPVVW